MARDSTRTVLIAIGVFVLIAALVKLAGAPLMDWLRDLHGPASRGH